MARKAPEVPVDPVVAEVRKGRREALEILRDKLAIALSHAEPAVIAQIAGRLQAVVKELDEIGTGEQKSRLDELADRRSVRESGADAAAPARRQARQRP